jgi:23S rRNA (cytosine1962-C5)-methyltransferase
MNQVLLKKKIGQRVLNGHPWIFANEVHEAPEGLEPGAVVDVFTHDKKFIGKGYFNPRSQILVRLLTRKKEEVINEEFFYNRLLEAWRYRQQLGYVENCRLIFGGQITCPS